ncbi:MAG: phosphatidate phosphatase App1 family protein [Phycisphaerales bacterium JB043]
MTRSLDSNSDDVQIELFASSAHLETRDDVWNLPLRGWVYRAESDSKKRRLAIGALRHSLGLEDEDETDCFKRRAGMFLARNIDGIRVPISRSGATHMCAPTGSDGHFEDQIRIPARDLTVDDHYRNTFLEPEGLSVISDIDDTVKITHVRSKKELLLNTFVRPFRAVEGARAEYQELASRGASFHYVSSSPWQLYGDLRSFLLREGFRVDEIHLRKFRLKDSSFVDFFRSSERFKPRVIRSILDRFPSRTFILIGDSGENDKAIYESIAADRPHQIEDIIIRDV